MDTTGWPTIVCGWAEVAHYIARNPRAQIKVEAAGNGAVRVYLPTVAARDEFMA
jgi:hypothetical protein